MDRHGESKSGGTRCKLGTKGIEREREVRAGARRIKHISQQAALRENQLEEGGGGKRRRG